MEEIKKWFIKWFIFEPALSRVKRLEHERNFISEFFCGETSVEYELERWEKDMEKAKKKLEEAKAKMT